MSEDKKTELTGDKKTELTGEEMERASGGRGWSLAAQKVEGDYGHRAEEKKPIPGGTAGGTPGVAPKVK